jgi:hypothetical protein
MQRQIIHGIPFFVDAQKRIYTWETEPGCKPQHIGSFSAEGEITFVSNHISALSSKLTEWRSTQKPRPRKPTATTPAAASSSTGRGHSGGKASSDSSPEDTD